MKETNEAYHSADDAIRNRILDLLLQDPGIDASKIEVEVHNAIVSLKGKADTEKEKKASEKIAREVEGVAGVENHLHIEGSLAHALSNLAAHIQGDIIRDTSKD